MIDPILFNQKKYTQIDELGRSSTIDTSGNINQQIENYLGPQDFLLYKEAEKLNSQLWESYSNQGLLITEVIYQHIFIPELNQSVDIEVGLKNSLAPGVHPSQLSMHPSYTEWVAKLPPGILQPTNLS
jgi:hypothetical protein